MPVFPTVISFYTEGTPYEIEVQNLIHSCSSFGLETSIEASPSFGSWELNCAYKPFFILKKMQELQKPLLWVDADGVFVSTPSWQEAFYADVSVRIHEDLPQDHPSKVISSTIFVSHTEKAFALMRAWAKACQESLLDPKRELEFWDQIALRDAYLSLRNQVKVSCLPLEYTKIFDHPLDNQKVKLAVIEHFQASRRFKRQITS